MEEAANHVLMIVNGLDIGSQDVAEIEQKVESLQHLEPENMEQTYEKLLKEIE
jgi:hypothetical protein